MSACVVDASVWVSYFLEYDVHHSASVSWLDRQLTDKICVPAIFLAEVAGAVARQTGLDLAHAAYHQLLQLPRLKIVGVDFELAVTAASLAIDLGLRGADATYVALAHSYAMPLVTWDDEQCRRAAVAITALAPTI